jgi:predicted transcriptional regulator
MRLVNRCELFKAGESAMALNRETIGREEMQILRHVADHCPVSVREVADHVAATSGKARTTVLTVMERLRKKGHLIRRMEEGVYRYSPKKSRAELLRGLVADFVRETLGGSVSPFVAYLADEADLDDEQVRELVRLVNELEARPVRDDHGTDDRDAR